ncbi:MurR/RpiR family transcriptional regulator [Anaeromicropila herbilytica]|uniref:RpiR family transcriptional regulator n=1 Tax=Anaeromicropila herbilytica TaxID=2785025 RepID=A0A7R7EL95_9FIRM|nr:MurR/RpiR family transcriptional regulator [Anaeromicropila herbilytica]BCN30838.1 RpiR family transcriptional regulator [Anaeromicropila herbilytica]
MALLDKLESMNNLTSVEKTIVAYIIENKELMVNFTISDLAMMTYTSNSSIIRLCRKLGLTGYKEFKIEFVKELERIRKQKSNININYPIHKKESSRNILKNIAELSKESIDTCYESISEKDMERAARYIQQANKIYIYAYGDSMVSAIGFANKLIKLDKVTIFPNEYGEVLAHTMNVKKNDVALFVSYTGSILVDERYLNILNKSGCKKILITSKSNVAGFDIRIDFPDKEDDQGKISTYYSQIAIQYILNCIYAIIFSNKE